ncbi:MAG: hypothetical protein AAGH79_12445 [Bacteroidota bacterium]
MKRQLLFSLLLLPFFLGAQVVTPLPDMPESVSNNAVVAAPVDGTMYVYSFAGIDSTKLWSGIHKKAWRYNTDTQIWESIPDLPNGNGRIAAGANLVKNKIYIIGGYEVFANGGEVSFETVHIYDPQSNTYLADGSPIPTPIDDQVQAVWRDSLIYVITGWSNNGNVEDVQIYNPSSDTWLEGTSLPLGEPNESDDFLVFGASGTIIGDTIYYSGGALGGFQGGSVFPPTTHFRKGYINPDDPTEITWTGEQEILGRGYRMAAGNWNDQQAVWIGGSTITYNYNGIDYNGSGGVAPTTRVVSYDPSLGQLVTFPDYIPARMDLRGLGQIGPDRYIIAGGMVEDQTVTNQVFELQLDLPTGTFTPLALERLNIYPNPSSLIAWAETPDRGILDVYDPQGRLIWSKTVEKGTQTLPIAEWAPGLYRLYWSNTRGDVQLGNLMIQ